MTGTKCTERGRWLRWAAGSVVTISFAILFFWAQFVWAGVARNADKIGNLEVDQAVLKTDVGYIRRGVERLEMLLGTAPAP